MTGSVFNLCASSGRDPLLDRVAIIEITGLGPSCPSAIAPLWACGSGRDLHLSFSCFSVDIFIFVFYFYYLLFI